MLSIVTPCGRGYRKLLVCQWICKETGWRFLFRMDFSLFPHPIPTEYHGEGANMFPARYRNRQESYRSFGMPKHTCLRIHRASYNSAGTYAHQGRKHICIHGYKHITYIIILSSRPLQYGRQHSIHPSLSGTPASFSKCSNFVSTGFSLCLDFSYQNSGIRHWSYIYIVQAYEWTSLPSPLLSLHSFFPASLSPPSFSERDCEGRSSTKTQ